MFLGTHISMPIIAYWHCNVGLVLRPICDVGLEDRPFFSQFPISLLHISFSRLLPTSRPTFPQLCTSSPNDGQISTVCDDQYSSTLAMLEETADEAFKV
jgi:hypothetical protein